MTGWGVTQCVIHTARGIYWKPHMCFFCQEPTVLNCLRISHTLINFCQLCHILGVCLPIIRAILTILVTLSERLKEILSGNCKIGCSTLCEYLNSGYTLINCVTLWRDSWLETRRACFTLSGRLKEATEDWVQRGNWTEIARLSQSCTRGQCSSINGKKTGDSHTGTNHHH